MTRGEERRWTIGEVARSARLTLAALRHYHDEGVLVPAWVDPVTRYRYYTETQVNDALRIGLLRQAGVPLADLRALAEGRLALDRLLERQRDRLSREIGARRRALALLDALGPARLPSPSGVTERELGEEEVDSLRVEASWDEVTAATRRGLTRLALAQRRAGLAVGGDPGAVFPLEPADRVGLRVFRAASGSVPPGAERWRLPSGRALQIDVCADHALLPLAYRAVLAAATRRGVVAGGEVVERYLPVTGGPPLTRLLLPLAEPAGGCELRPAAPSSGSRILPSSEAS